MSHKKKMRQQALNSDLKCDVCGGPDLKDNPVSFELMRLGDRFAMLAVHDGCGSDQTRKVTDADTQAMDDRFATARMESQLPRKQPPRGA